MLEQLPKLIPAIIVPIVIVGTAFSMRVVGTAVPTRVVGTAVKTFFPTMIVVTAVPAIIVLMAYYWKSCIRPISNSVDWHGEPASPNRLLTRNLL